MVEQLAVKHKLPLSLEYNTNLGYHVNVIIPRGLNMTISDLPAEFIQVNHFRRGISIASNIFRDTHTGRTVLLKYL